MRDTVQHSISQDSQARREGRSLEALRAYGEVAAMARELGDRALLAEALSGVGRIEKDLGDFAHYREVEDICRRIEGVTSWLMLFAALGMSCGT